MRDRRNDPEWAALIKSVPDLEEPEPQDDPRDTYLHDLKMLGGGLGVAAISFVVGAAMFAIGHIFILIGIFAYLGLFFGLMAAVMGTVSLIFRLLVPARYRGLSAIFVLLTIPGFFIAVVWIGCRTEGFQKW